MLWRRPRRKSSSLTGGELTFCFFVFPSNCCFWSHCEGSEEASSEEPPVKDQLTRLVTARSCDSAGGGRQQGVLQIRKSILDLHHSATNFFKIKY